MSYPVRAVKVGVASPSSEAASRTVHVKLIASFLDKSCTKLRQMDYQTLWISYDASLDYTASIYGHKVILFCTEV